MQYYYLDGLDKKGPYTLEELKTRNLKPETLVFSDGMDSWKPIKEIENITSVLFEQTNKSETGSSEITEIEIVDPVIKSSETVKDLELDTEPNKIKIPSIILLFLLYGISIGIAYFISFSQKQNDHNELTKKIEDIFGVKSAITDYTFDGTDGQLYDVYLSNFRSDNGFTGLEDRIYDYLGYADKDEKDIVRTKKRTLATKPSTLNPDQEKNATIYENKLKQWNLFKDLVQYYECKQFSGFDVIRLEKNSSEFSITKSWSGDMAYKVAESTHHAGYSSEYFSSPGYDIPTYRPSISNCYIGAAKFLTSDREDNSYEAGSFNKILSFTKLEGKFYEVSQNFPKYTRLFDKIKVHHGPTFGEGDLIDDTKITDATSATDASVYTSQWIVWYKSITNTYSLGEKNGVFIKYWVLYSTIGIAIMTLLYFGLKYRKRIALK